MKIFARTCKTLLIKLIEFYQSAVRPYLMKSCRFHPSCSCYAKEAIEKHGAAKGSALAFLRVAKCSPFSRGGWDPVPEVLKITEPKGTING